jgi:hypothetical protein
VSTRYTTAQVIEALETTKGVYLAAKRLRCAPATVYNYIKRFATVKEAWEAIDGETTDIAVLKLRQAILDGDPWAVKFQLSTKGRERGYVERHEVEQVGETVIRMTWGDDDETDNQRPAPGPASWPDEGDGE